MKNKNASIPEALNRFLLTFTDDETSDLSAFVAQGGALVTPDVVRALCGMRAAVQEKIKLAASSERLRLRLEAALRFVEEIAGERRALDVAGREVSFALLYFLKGYDRIPDSIPDIGLLDDALVLNSALERNRDALRNHWDRHHRVWPDNL